MSITDIDDAMQAPTPVQLTLNAGDAVIFDARLLHAGSANRSTARRPILYFVYGRSWYTTGLHRKICEDSGIAEPGAYPEKLFKVRGDA